jgi:hypothetical protein
MRVTARSGWGSEWWWRTRAASRADSGGSSDAIPKIFLEWHPLAALAAFHDVGKFNHGFQNKADRNRRPHSGHVSEVLRLFDSEGIEWLRPNLPLDEINDWAEHNIWRAQHGRDPFGGIADLTARVQRP